VVGEAALAAMADRGTRTRVHPAPPKGPAVVRARGGPGGDRGVVRADHRGRIARRLRAAGGARAVRRSRPGSPRPPWRRADCRLTPDAQPPEGTAAQAAVPHGSRMRWSSRKTAPWRWAEGWALGTPCGSAPAR